MCKQGATFICLYNMYNGKSLKLAVILVLTVITMSCHENPHNTFGGPSNNPKAAGKGDTSSQSTRGRADH
jgi:hypothetical protein